MSPTLTAEELTNQVLEMRGTEAGMDLWLTFEIREHGELGEHDHVCVYTHVMGGIKVTSAFCVTKYSDTVLVHVKGHPTQLITPSFSVLSPFLTLWTQVLGFPSSPKKAFLLLCLYSKYWKDPEFNHRPFSFLYLHFSLDESSIPMALNAIHKLGLWPKPLLQAVDSHIQLSTAHLHLYVSQASLIYFYLYYYFLLGGGVGGERERES